MRKYSKIFICSLLLQITLIGCAHLGTPVEKLNIDEIKGAWEHIHFGYIYLYIDDYREGFLISGIDENEDIFKIKSITFDGSFAIMTLSNISENDETVKAECTLFGDDLLAFTPVEDGEKEDSLLFMRESKINKLRISAKEFIENNSSTHNN